MPARTVGLLFWLALGGLAALVLLWRIGHPPQPPVVRPAPPPELPAVAPLEPFGLSPPAQYSEVAIRPLFIAERRPEPPPPPDETPPEKPATGPEQKFILFGVMIMPGTQAALLRPEAPNARTMRVGVGEMIGEWRLDTVLPDRVILRKGETTQDLPLTRPRKPGKPRAKRADAPQPGQDATPPAQVPAPPTSVLIGPGGMPAGSQLNAPPPVAAPPQ
ncbi:MAG: hypothetical protein P9F19_14685 [Candidatus Contendobacter sp.]|nr:hypothetical protein [Candidatus Contendobacter sp.]MDG4558619.1 hypothetical protein [Candidatus Contendobacter sp.]